MVESWGEVFAAYDHSCYVQMADGRMICIADGCLDDGPITVRVASAPHVDFKALGVRLGMPLHMEGGDWLLGDDILLRISGAPRWVPPAISGFASPATVRNRLRTLGRCLERDVPAAGLASLVRHAEDLADGRPINLDRVSHLARLASQRLAELVQGVKARNERQIDDGVCGLIGLGPGLTPSGDDLLAGLMIGLITTPDSWGRATQAHQVERPLGKVLSEATAELTRAILRHAATGTTQISNALLSHAVQGVGSDSVHRLLQALLQRDDAPEPTPAALQITRTGHTSGWDCLAGILLGIHIGIRLRETATGAHSGFDGDAQLQTVV